jgi:hypothetical protein
LTFKVVRVTLIFNVQLPGPFPSNMAASVEPGTLAPPIPPEAVDQLAEVFQFAEPAATQ